MFSSKFPPIFPEFIVHGFQWTFRSKIHREILFIPCSAHFSSHNPEVTCKAITLVIRSITSKQKGCWTTILGRVSSLWDYRGNKSECIVNMSSMIRKKTRSVVSESCYRWTELAFCLSYSCKIKQSIDSILVRPGISPSSLRCLSAKVYLIISHASSEASKQSEGDKILILRKIMM